MPRTIARSSAVIVRPDRVPFEIIPSIRATTPGSEICWSRGGTRAGPRAPDGIEPVRGPKPSPAGGQAPLTLSLWCRWDIRWSECRGGLGGLDGIRAVVVAGGAGAILCGHIVAVVGLQVPGIRGRRLAGPCQAALVAAIAGRIRVGPRRIDVVVRCRRSRSAWRQSDRRSRPRPGRFVRASADVATCGGWGEGDCHRRVRALRNIRRCRGRCRRRPGRSHALAVLPGIPMEPPLADHAGSSLTGGPGRLAFPKTNGRINTRHESESHAKNQFDRKSWLMIRPSARFLGCPRQIIGSRSGIWAESIPWSGLWQASGIGPGPGMLSLGPPGARLRSHLGVCGGHQSDLCLRENTKSHRSG